MNGRQTRSLREQPEGGGQRTTNEGGGLSSMGLLRAEQGRQPSQNGEDNKAEHTQCEQDGADDATDPPRIGVGATGCVHLTGVHCFEIRIAHNPGEDPQWSANDEAEYA